MWQCSGECLTQKGKPGKEVFKLATAPQPDWQDKLRYLEDEIARYRQRRQELQSTLESLERAYHQPGRPAPVHPAQSAPSPVGPETPPPPAGPVSPEVPPPPSGPTPPATPPPSPPPGGQPGSRPRRWKERWRQAILDGLPQEKLDQAKNVFSLAASHLEQVEGSLKAAAAFLEEVNRQIEQPGEGVTIRQVRELIDSEPFRRFVVHTLASVLRESTTHRPAHLESNSILCSAPTQPQARSGRREVVYMKTNEFLWWWILIILLIFVLFFFVFPLGGNAAQQ